MRRYVITVGRVQRMYTNIKDAIEAFEWIRARIDGELINCVKGQIEIYLEYTTEDGNVAISLVREEV